MNSTDLEARLREAKEELFNLRFQAATGQLESHGRLRTVKKDIARIYTVVRERELGIRSHPDSGNNAKDNAKDNADKAQKEGADA
jgi:large subunit ribosomal protein L29